MKHFITGGAGFFGLHLLDRLLKENQEVVVYDIAPLEESYRTKPDVSFVQGDVREKEKLLWAMKDCDVVHHNAAVLPIARSGKEYWDINVEGTRNVLEAALANKVRKVISVSTSAVYGIPKKVPINEETPLTPLGDYAQAKFDAEQICKEFRSAHDLDITILRPRTICGSGRLGIFGILFDWIRRGKRVYVIGDGTNLFQLVSARDLAEANWLMTVKPCKNEDFNIGTDRFGTVAQDLKALIEHAGTGARVQPVNAFMVRTILGFADMLRISPLVDWHYKTPHKPFYFDTTKAQTMLGWKAKDSNIEMYIETYDWYLQNLDKAESTTGTTHRKTVKQGILKLLRAIS